MGIFKSFRAYAFLQYFNIDFAFLRYKDGEIHCALDKVGDGGEGDDSKASGPIKTSVVMSTCRSISISSSSPSLFHIAYTTVLYDAVHSRLPSHRPEPANPSPCLPPSPLPVQLGFGRMGYVSCTRVKSKTALVGCWSAKAGGTVGCTL